MGRIILFAPQLPDKIAVGLGAGTDEGVIVLSKITAGEFAPETLGLPQFVR